jgi:hypothetical protein
MLAEKLDAVEKTNNKNHCPNGEFNFTYAITVEEIILYK